MKSATSVPPVFVAHTKKHGEQQIDGTVRITWAICSHVFKYDDNNIY